MSTVLVVDDEDRVRTFLRRSVTAEDHEVLEAATGDEAIQVLAENHVDLVLLDLVMPGRDGLSVLEEINAQPSPPAVIVLSGIADVGARVAALEHGAADFVAKPFHLSELMARARRHLGGRKASALAAVGPRILEAGSVRLDLDRRRVRMDGREEVLAEREFTLLAHLMYRRGQVCRKHELLHDVWGFDFDPGSNVVEVAVRRLRLKLHDLPIETVRGVGYCFVVAEAS
jgi:DNA-binding response OmpR family regulator